MTVYSITGAIQEMFSERVDSCSLWTTQTVISCVSAFGTMASIEGGERIGWRRRLTTATRR